MMPLWLHTSRPVVTGLPQGVSVSKKTKLELIRKDCLYLKTFKKKMGITRNKDSNPAFEGENPVRQTNMHPRSNRRAWKTTRKIELGWIHDNRQV